MAYQTLDVGACTDPHRALEEAGFLLWPVSRPEEAFHSYWHQLARELLACYLMAAAIDGGSLDTVRGWAEHPSDTRPVELLRSGPQPALAERCQSVLDCQYAPVSDMISSALQRAREDPDS
ncbi:hypothetical protein [Streptomyces sp. NPDC048192]|uniref:hypothetical protein n=1 Tax=Streptomyces sp. NPDC048192 TaxID=3365510 RepID=UPI003711B086